MSMTGNPMKAVFAFALTAVASAYTPAAMAHGAPEYPISRQYNCFKNPSQPACQAASAVHATAVYDWNGVNQGAAAGNHMAVVPDRALCAGGQTMFRAYDAARNDWAATPYSPGADGKYEFRYNATAPHRTLNWQFYLTRDGANASSKTLTWSDLDLVQTLTEKDMVVTNGGKQYNMKLSLPQRTGKHVLYSIWQRSDSGEAFYGCSDVDFGGGSGGTPPSVPSDLKQIGQVSAKQDLPAQSQVKLRVFGKEGNDLETIALTLNSATSKAQWLSQLATRTNQQSGYLKIGALQGGVVNVPSGVSEMDVYLRDANSGATFVLNTSLPQTPVQPPVTNPDVKPPVVNPPVVTPPTDGGNASAWVEGGSYKVGQVVSYGGKQYRCIQAHTAWKGAGWTPNAGGVLGILWAPL